MVKTSLPNCAMTRLAFVSTIGDGQVDTPQSPQRAIQQKMREVLIGFDSAWAGSSKNPGAISAYVLEGGNTRLFIHLGPLRSVTLLTSLGESP